MYTKHLLHLPHFHPPINQQTPSFATLPTHLSQLTLGKPLEITLSENWSKLRGSMCRILKSCRYIHPEYSPDAPGPNRNHLTQRYSTSLSQSNTIDQDTIHLLFPNLNKLLNFQRRFLIKLEATAEQAWKDQRWGLHFTEMAGPSQFSQYFVPLHRPPGG